MSDNFQATDYFYQPGPLDKYYDLQEQHHWSHSEIDSSNDAKEFPLMSEDFQKIIKCIIMFFLLGDKVIIDNIQNRLVDILGTDDAQRFFMIQSAQELIHVRTYTNIARSIFVTNERFQKLLEDCEKSETIRLKIGYGHNWINNDDATPFERFISAACNEGIFFITQFRIISVIRHTTGNMTGLDEANRFIQNDEEIHRNANVVMAQIILKREADERSISYEQILEEHHGVFNKIVMEAVEIELQSIDDIFSGTTTKLINITEMKETTYRCADTICSLMGYPTIYDVLDATDYAGIETEINGKANFWEINSVYTTPVNTGDVSASDVIRMNISEIDF